MQCWLLWHGGASYAVSDAADAEHFDSLRDLVASFERRLWDSYYPCVSDEPAEDGGQSGWIFFYDPRASDGDLYPDRIIEHGPRGGIRVTPA